FFFFDFLRSRLLRTLKKYFDRFIIREKRFQDRERFELGRYRMGLLKKVRKVRRRRIRKFGEIFLSLPFYLEMNYKIMSFVFVRYLYGLREIIYPYGFSKNKYLLLNTF